MTVSSLTTLLHRPETILLESSRTDDVNRKNLLFQSPREILRADALYEIPPLFDRLEEALRQGNWIAGFLSYEAGDHFEPAVPPFDGPLPLPLVRFGIYPPPLELSASLLGEHTEHDGHVQEEIGPPRFSITDERYAAVIDRLKNYIVNGDTYQVNFTGRFEFAFHGDPIGLYSSLRKQQHVPFSALINLGSAQILSFSPELFFRRNGNSITVRPMKGTYRRGRTTAEDRQFSELLRNDEKNRSENLMIVDLLRNDLGRISEAGSVIVRSLYDVERLHTVLQMTSTIDGTLRAGIPYYDIFSALFPCGSVTGAPKIRTMQIIREVEDHPRGAYCGAIGYISPDQEAVFSVAIRTVHLQGGKGIMGAGSGIVYDSIAAQELEECKLKGAFLVKKDPDFDLFETLLWDGRYTFLTEHLSRLEDSAMYFMIPFNGQEIKDALHLTERAFDPQKKFRIRLLLSKRGVPTVEAIPFTPTLSSSTIRIANDRTNSADPLYYHKTTHRPLYGRYRDVAEREQIADVIFLNERNEVTEGCITNIFIEKGDQLLTPPVSSGLLNGVYRQYVLRTKPNAVETTLFSDDLRHADAIYICNSLRGWSKVTLSE